MTKDELLEKIKNQPNTAKNYLLLAFMLNAPDETVELLKQNPLDPEELPVILTQRQLFLKTIQLDRCQSIAYLALKNQLQDDQTITLNDGRTLNKRQLILEAIHNAPNQSLAYSALAFVTENDQPATLLDGRIMNKNQLYLEAVHLERQIGLMWFRGQYFVTPPGKVTLPDGRQLSQEQLVAAYVANRQDDLVIAGLVLTMKAATKIFIPDQLPITTTPPPGQDKTREDLAIEAIKIAYKKAGDLATEAATIPPTNTQALQTIHNNISRCAFPFFVLLLTMNPDDVVNTTIPAIGSTGHQGILKEVIRLAPLNPSYYLYGGLWLKPGETMTLANGQVMNQRQMLLKVLELEPTNAWAHVGLGYTIAASESITLAGTAKTRQQLFLNAVTLDPNLPLAYLCLALSMPPGDKTPIIVNGAPMTELQLFDKYNSFSEAD